MCRAVLLATLIVLVHLPAFAKAGIYELPLAGTFCTRDAG